MKSTTDYSDIVVFGTRGHTLDVIRGMEDYWQDRVHVRAMIDEIENGFMHPLLSVPVISMEARERDWADLPVFVAVANPELRARICRQLAAEGAVLVTAISPGQTHVDPAVKYGAACLCAPYTRVGPNVSIGTGAHVMATLIAHDIEVGAYSNVAVNSSVLGHVKIGDGVNIAPHAVIGNGTREKPLIIGSGAIVGVGAVVVRDVPPGAKVGGNPAMPIDRWKKLRRLLDDIPD